MYIVARGKVIGEWRAVCSTMWCNPMLLAVGTVKTFQGSHITGWSWPNRRPLPDNHGRTVRACVSVHRVQSIASHVHSCVPVPTHKCRVEL